MLKKLVLVFAIAALLTSSLQAQSYNKGSSNSGSSNSAASANKARMMQKEVDKMVGKITRNEFAGITLDKAQRGTLKSLAETNMPQISDLTQQIGQLIPSNQLSKLERSYKSAVRDGKSKKDAMVASMLKIGLPEATQEKILMLQDSKTEIMNKITMGVAATFTEEQNSIFAEKMAMKEAAMADKEGMMEKTTTGSGSKEAMGSGAKEPMGSGAKEPMGSETKAAPGSGAKATAGSGSR